MIGRSRLLLTIGLVIGPLSLSGQDTQLPGARTVNPHGASVRETCSACHGPNSWVPARISKDFRHAENTFPLTGAHATAACASCHTSLNFAIVVKSCANCHADVHKGELGADCARCHTPRSFTDRAAMTRMHQLSRFPLRGGHASVACESCHPPTRSGQPQFLRANTTCMSCHATTFRQTTSPPHVEPSFSPNCTLCHTTMTWAGGKFDHSLTLFALTGAHKSALCTDCHADRQYRGRSMDCVSCHQTDYNRTTNPPHQQGFPTTCTSCHNTVRWQDATFDHGQMTRFALTGAHRTLTCVQCHGDQTFKGRSMDCVSCHRTDYDQTVSPKHAPAGFATTCATCHTTVQWKGATFDHNVATKFALTGAHRTATCLQCHADNVYAGKSMLCSSCHQTEYNATKAPPHGAAGFPNTCEGCHTTTQWPGAAFDHNTTLFPLTGAHRAALCMDCHADNIFKGKPTDCVSCHQTDYNGTTNPSHASSGFSTLCQTCHTTTQWPGAVFDHNKTLFPLTGAHLAASCTACHADGVYKGKATQCSACHLTDYNAAISPNHKASGFPTTCETCHTTTAWTGAPFDHSTTLFPLTGKHTTATCMDCHSDGVYKGKSTLCISCHQAAWNGTTNPNHVQSGFPTTCEACHTTTQWLGAVFNHSATKFPLTGAHLAATCMDCHSDGVYQGKPTACVSCHQAVYNATKNPPHAAAGFSTLCDACHTTVQWPGATFDHSTTLFPLTGAHITATCMDCHSDGVYKGKSTACVSCHQTEYNNSTNPHHIPAGFSTLCQSCHTTVKFPGAPYDHTANTTFPLTGAHIGQQCLACHASKVYKGLATTCVSCHLADYNATTNPVHQAAMFPTTCQDCHTTTQWLGATFNHDAAYFPIYSGSHFQRWTRCSDCHVNSTSYAVFECILCHAHSDKAKVDADHVGKVSGYQYKSTACYACHPKGTH